MKKIWLFRRCSLFFTTGSRSNWQYLSQASTDSFRIRLYSWMTSALLLSWLTLCRSCVGLTTDPASCLSDFLTDFSIHLELMRCLSLIPLEVLFRPPAGDLTENFSPAFSKLGCSMNQ